MPPPSRSYFFSFPGFDQKKGDSNSMKNLLSDLTEPIECGLCTPFTHRASVGHLLSSCEWEFFYCFNCKNWFRALRDNPKELFLIRDQRLARSLQYFTRAEEFFQPTEYGHLAQSRTSLIGRVAFKVYNFISPFLEEEEDASKREN